MRKATGWVRGLAAGVLVSVAGSAGAVEVLFGFVDDDGPYVDDGQALAQMVRDLPGYNVTETFLDAGPLPDLGGFDQVWVYDLFTGADDEATQLANYAAVADWYNARAPSLQNLIVDGRIISSGPAWTTPAEVEWIQNYALQLDAAGGGLVLGTDHAETYTEGINVINTLIGINPFTGFFFEEPFEAFVDPLSPLFVASLETCTSDATKKCINDNSSTSFVPTGPQPSGVFLTPVAYHGTESGAFDNAAVAATFESPTFPAPAPGTLALLGLGLAGAGLVGRRRRR